MGARAAGRTPVFTCEAVEPPQAATATDPASNAARIRGDDVFMWGFLERII
jgi:hypothetical protein